MNCLALLPGLSRLEVGHIRATNQDTIVGYEVSLIDHTDRCVGGGVSASRPEAISKGISESIERTFFAQALKDPQLKSEFLLEDFPSTCGFAVGSDSSHTRRRARNEALERWAFSQWIDLKRGMTYILPDDLSSEISNNALTKYLLSEFQETQFFEKQIIDIDGSMLTFVVCLGFTAEGVFAGSKVSASRADGISHASSETWRHRKVFGQIQDPKRLPKALGLIEKRILFFGKNKFEALAQIPQADSNPWQAPAETMNKTICDLQRKIFLNRTLMSSFRGWHEGGVTRFVY
jgi:hypothetical protein